MTPAWIKGLAEAWGHHMRRFEAQLGPTPGTMGRILDEGEGAAIRGHGGHTPNVDFPVDVQRFHRAWTDLDFIPRSVIYVHFKKRGPIKKKLAEMEISKSRYYRLLNRALQHLVEHYHLYE